jgi:hypothetical protein
MEWGISEEKIGESQQYSENKQWDIVIGSENPQFFSPSLQREEILVN